MQSIIDAVSAALRAQLQLLLAEQLPERARVDANDARTGELEQFAESLKPGAPDQVVRERQLYRDTQQLELDWQAGDERVLGELRPVLQQAQTQAQELGVRVDECEARLPADGQSQWLQDKWLRSVDKAAELLEDRFKGRFKQIEGHRAHGLQDGLESRLLQQLDAQKQQLQQEQEDFRWRPWSCRRPQGTRAK